MSLTFFTRSCKQGGKVGVWMKYRKGASVDIRLNTGLLVDVELWEKYDVKSGKFGKRLVTPAMAEVMNVLNGIKSDVVNAEQKNGLILTKEQLKGIAAGYVKVATMQEPVAGLDPEPEPEVSDMVRYCKRMLADMREHNRLKPNSDNAYSTNSIKSWTSFSHILEGWTDEYAERTGRFLTFEMCDKNDTEDTPRKTATSFLSYLRECEYNAKYRDKCIKNMRTFVSYAMQDNACHTANWLEYLKGVELNDILNDAQERVYLTEAEVQALYEMELSGYNDQVRDVFLVGCYTGQRVSDYNGMKKDSFGVTAKGVKVVRLIQQKTKKRVVIPILNENLERIAAKYPDGIPTLNEPVLNRDIKKILNRLAATVPSLSEEYKTKVSLSAIRSEKKGKMVLKRDSEGNVVKEKWELVTTHTARRTFITNMYLTHKYSNLQIMSISGHTTEKMLLNYIRLSDDSKAEDIAEIANDGLF